jgi:hypothetical protein
MSQPPGGLGADLVEFAGTLGMSWWLGSARGTSKSIDVRQPWQRGVETHGPIWHFRKLPVYVRKA